MGHNITALVVPGPGDGEVLRRYDLRPIALAPGLSMMPIDHYYSAYWQSIRGLEAWLEVPPGFACIFPREVVLAAIVAELTGHPQPRFAVIQTDYFGGAGGQYACVYEGERRASADDETSINAALRRLGVVRRPGLDEFDTVGLSAYRSNPDYLDRYSDLCDEQGV